ncbi:MAG: DUF169 domain-containing protein [Firmicutes bacterium]|nr:DUF169 domain-containing protein [Bacillota bacterium]
MSYSEFIKELKLEDCVIASTRVDSADYKCDDLFGCVYKVFPQVLRGRTVVLKKGSCSCGGFNNNSGLVDDRPSIPGGFGVFLSHGSDQMWTPKGEKFKCCPETAEAMFDSLPKNVMDGHDAIKFEPYREGMKADVVTVFCTIDQLSALFNLHGYNRGYYDHIAATTASGCASMLRVPFSEIGKEKSRAIITATDLAQRKFVPEDKMAISFTGEDFEYMMSITHECFFHAEVFKKIRERIHKSAPETRYTGLA